MVYILSPWPSSSYRYWYGWLYIWEEMCTAQLSQVSPSCLSNHCNAYLSSTVLCLHYWKIIILLRDIFFKYIKYIHYDHILIFWTLRWLFKNFLISHILLWQFNFQKYFISSCWGVLSNLLHGFSTADFYAVFLKLHQNLWERGLRISMLINSFRERLVNFENFCSKRPAFSLKISLF